MVRQACDKGFYVSPFMDMDLKYAFRVRPPGDQVQVLVDVDDAEGRVLATGFVAERVRDLTDRNRSAPSVFPAASRGCFSGGTMSYKPEPPKINIVR